MATAAALGTSREGGRGGGREGVRRHAGGAGEARRFRRAEPGARRSRHAPGAGGRGGQAGSGVGAGEGGDEQPVGAAPLPRDAAVNGEPVLTGKRQTV